MQTLKGQLQNLEAALEASLGRITEESAAFQARAEDAAAEVRSLASLCRLQEGLTREFKAQAEQLASECADLDSAREKEGLVLGEASRLAQMEADRLAAECLSLKERLAGHEAEVQQHQARAEDSSARSEQLQADLDAVGHSRAVESSTYEELTQVIQHLKTPRCALALLLILLVVFIKGLTYPLS